MAVSSAFTSMTLSLALERSMKFNSRRLETIGYAFSVLFFQYLIAGHEDIFLICPQFPVDVSPRDSTNPDTTVPDAKAKGVYVDLSLLMVEGSQRGGALCRVKLSEALSQAYQDRSLWLYQYLDVIRLLIPKFQAVLGKTVYVINTKTQSRQEHETPHTHIQSQRSVEGERSAEIANDCLRQRKT